MNQRAFRDSQTTGAAGETEIAIAVVEHDGLYLIGRRPADAVLGGLWEFPGGKIEPGESPQEAAVRECREESGLEVTVEGRYPQVAHVYPHGRVLLHFFACRPRDASQTLRAPYRWIPAADLDRYEFPPANAELLLRLRCR